MTYDDAMEGLPVSKQEAILEYENHGFTAEELKRAKVAPFDANPVRKLLRQIEKDKKFYGK